MFHPTMYQARLVELLMDTLYRLREERIKLVELKKQVRVQDAMVRQQQALKERRLKKTQGDRAEDTAAADGQMDGQVEVLPRAKLREWHHRLKQLKQHVHQQQEEGVDMVPDYKHTPPGSKHTQPGSKHTQPDSKHTPPGSKHLPSPALAVSDSSGNLDDFFKSVSEAFRGQEDFPEADAAPVTRQLEEVSMAIAADNQSEVYGDGTADEYLYLQHNMFMKGDHVSWN